MIIPICLRESLRSEGQMTRQTDKGVHKNFSIILKSVKKYHGLRLIKWNFSLQKFDQVFLFLC